MALLRISSSVCISIPPIRLLPTLVAAWKTLDHYKKMMQHSGYAAVLASLAAVHTGPASVLHYDMTDDPSKAFSAPLTDLSYATLKDGKSKDAIKPFVDAVGKYIDLSHGYSRMGCGKARYALDDHWMGVT